MKVRLTITGTAPLLMNNSRLANPLDPIVRAKKPISAKTKKTDKDHLELARLNFHGALYVMDGVGPYMPGANIEKCLVQAGAITKNGKRIERGLFVTDDLNPLIYDGPRDADALWDDESFRSMMSVVVSRRRIMQCRPIFSSWAVETTAELDESQLNLETLQDIANDAGAMIGIGDYRPRYGRFTAEVAAL